MKKQEIKLLLIAIAERKGIRLWLTDSKVEEIAEKLSRLESTNRSEIRSYISDSSIYIKESVDFTDIDYLLDQIVVTVNKR
jgi:hypothetical protein